MKKKRFKNAVRASEHLHSLKTRLTATFFILVMIPILIIGLVTSLLYRNSMINKINEVVDSNTLQSTQTISERLETYRNNLYQAVTDQNIINLADHLEDASTELDRAYGQQNLRFALSEYINIKSYCTALTFLYNSDYVTYDRTADDFVTIWHNDYYRKLFLDLCKPGSNTVVYVSGVDISLSENDVASKSVYLVYPLRDQATNRYLGVIVLSLQNKIFDTSMQNSQMKSNNMQGIQSAVISQKKKVVFPSSQSESDTEKLSDTIWNSPNILTHEISDSKWYFVTALDPKILFSEVDNMQRWFILITVATCLLFLNILLLRPAFLNCPVELEDSAKIDGCNIVTCFLRIIVPISKPAIITAGAFGFIMTWNDLIYSMSFNTKEELRPMTANIYTYMNQYGTQWNNIMAYGVLLILPIAIIFILLQKYIVSGLTSGAVKG